MLGGGAPLAGALRGNEGEAVLVLFAEDREVVFLALIEGSIDLYERGALRDEATVTEEAPVCRRVIAKLSSLLVLSTLRA